MLRKKLNDLIAVRPGEGPASALLFLCFLTFSAGNCLGLSASESLFIRSFGITQIPFAFMMTSVMVVAVSLFLNRMSSRTTLTDLTRLVYGIMIPLILFLATMAFAFPHNPWTFAALFAIAYASLGLLRNLAISLTEEVFDLRQMKRLFALISSGGVLGMAIGGFGTGLLLKVFQDTRALLVIWAVLLFTSFILSAMVLSRYARKVALTELKRAETPKLLAGFGHLKDSRLFLYLSILAFFTAFAVTHYDFLYMYSVKKSFDNAEAVTRVFGMVRGISTIVTFLIQFFLTGYVLRVFGVTPTLLSFPLAVLGFFSLIGMHFSMGYVFSGRFGYYITKEAFFFPSFQPLFNALPEKIRRGAAFFINSVMGSMGNILAGLFLIIFIKGALLTPKHSAWISAVAGLFLIGFTILTRRQYLKELLTNISENSPKELDMIEALRNANSGNAKAILIDMLHSEDIESIRFALEFLRQNRSADTDAAVLKLIINSDNAKVLRAALFYFGEKPTAELFEKTSLIYKKGVIGARPILELFEKVLNSENSLVGQEKVFAEERRQKKILPAIREAKEHADVLIKVRAWVLAYHFGNEADVNEMQVKFKALFQTAPLDVKLFAIGLLNQDHNPFITQLNLENLEALWREASGSVPAENKLLLALLKTGDESVYDLLIQGWFKSEALQLALDRELKNFLDPLKAEVFSQRLFEAFETQGVASSSLKVCMVLLFVKLCRVTKKVIPLLIEELKRSRGQVNYRQALISKLRELTQAELEESNTKKDRELFESTPIGLVSQQVLQEEIEEAHYDLLASKKLTMSSEANLETFKSEMERRLDKRIHLLASLLVLLYPLHSVQAAVMALDSGEKASRLAALETLESVLPPKLRNRLFPLFEREDEKMTTSSELKAMWEGSSQGEGFYFKRIIGSDSPWESCLGLSLCLKLGIPLSETEKNLSQHTSKHQKLIASVFS